jgi:hypothetical protein
MLQLIRFSRINDEAVSRGRPILVFFESEGRINQFLASDYGRRMPPHQFIVESTPDVPWRVSKATAPSQVTLLSRVFGHGLDFKVNHPSIESVDGVCVICTFFPGSASEEIQIRGRAARQGKKGTFEFIVCQPDLQRDFSATPEQLKDSPYEFLVKQRTIQTDHLLDSKIDQVNCFNLLCELLIDERCRSSAVPPIMTRVWNLFESFNKFNPRPIPSFKAFNVSSEVRGVQVRSIQSFAWTTLVP